MDFWNDDRFRSWLKQQAQLQTYLRQFNDLPKHIKPPVLDSAALQSLTVAQNTLHNVLSPLDSSLLGAYAQLAGKDINLLKQIRSMNVRWLQQIQPAIPFDQLQILRDQAAVFDRMAWKMTALGQITSSLPDALLTAWNSTSTVLQYLNRYHQSILSKYTVEAVRDHVTLVEASLIPPTLTTAALVDVTYDLVEDHLTRKNEVHERSPRFQTSSFEGNDIKSTVESLLTQVGQRFVDKWNGSWEVMASRHSDYQSQATHSGRELLMQLLAELAPDTQFPGEAKITRKMRVKHVLGSKKSHAIDLVNGYADTIDNVYDVLCGEAHRRDEHVRSDATIIGYLYALGGMVTILLTYQQRNRNDPE